MVHGGTAGRRVGRWLVAALLIAVQAVLLLLTPSPSGPAVAAPGSPGTPQPPTNLFLETFELNPASTPILVTNYTGTNGMRYTADPPWLQSCNGNVVAQVMTAIPANCGGLTGFATQGMANLRSLAYALGVLQNSAAPQNNRAVSAYTDRGDNSAVDPGAPFVQIQTANPIVAPPRVGKRYVTFSVDVSALQCARSAPLLQFSLLSDGTTIQLPGQINACTDPRGRDVIVPSTDPATGGSISVHIGSYATSNSIATTGSSLGIRMVNNNGSGNGNDAAIDNLQLLDATPQLDKAFSPAVQVAGQPAQLTFTITNTAELASKLGWSFTDALPVGMKVASPAATTTCSNGVVAAPADSTSISVTGDLLSGQASCTVTVNVTAPAGHYVNTAANVTPNGVNPPGSSAMDFQPVLTLQKVGVPNDLNGNGSIDPGETISYSFTVTNPVSNGVTLSTVAVSDPRVGPVTCTVTTLAPGQATTCTATYTVTQADVDAGVVNNTATATATAPAGVLNPAPVTDSASTPLPHAPALTVVKSVDPPLVSSAGETVHYTVVVTNTGNVTLTAVAVTENAFTGTGPPPVISCPTTTLAAGASTTCTGTYTVTQADVNTGKVSNTATASGTPPTGPRVTSEPFTAVLVITQGPSITVVKSVDPTSVNAAGSTVTYRFAVTNTGNVDLTGVVVNETAFSGTGTRPVISCPTTALAPGASTTCTATYTVTQADVNAGSVTDIATASGTPPTGPAVSSPQSTAVLTIPAGPSITMTKSANPSSVNVAGDTVTYSFLTTNTGNVELTNVTITELAFSGTGSPPVASCPTTTLPPGASTTCTATYTVTQADVNAGRVDNSARATGTPPSGPVVDSPVSSSVVTIAAGPALTLVKSVDPTSVSSAGDTVTYSFAVSNTGNVNLTGILVTETAFSGTGTAPVISCPATALAPGVSTTCTATYTVTQADVNTGSVTNSATASGTPPTGPAVTTPESTAVLTIPAGPALTLVKSVEPTSVNAAGETVTYSFLVTNTGNVDLTGVLVNETAFTGAGPVLKASCPVTTLAPGASTICTATYTVTQADVNAGSVTNTATVTGTPPTGPAVTSPPATAVVTVPAGPALTLLKSVDPTSVSRAGDAVTYSFLVTNTGNVDLTGVAITETAFSGTGAPPVASCALTALAPGASMTCTATYTVTQADVNAGSVTDTATVSGTPPTGPAVTSPQSTAVVSIPAGPALTVVKSVDPTSVSRAGETVTYSFLVTNTGNVDLTGVLITETAFSGTGTPPVASCPATPLAPGASFTCTATYTVTQPDVNAGSVTNTATATGTPPTGPAVTSPPANAMVMIPVSPTLTMVKSVSPSSAVAAGDPVTYSFDVTNTGNVDLTGVVVNETLFTGTGTPLVISCPTTTLAPGASTTCTATYMVTQADVNAGTVTNTATASGTPPTGPAVTSPESTAVVSIPAGPALTLVKSANPTSVSAAGDTVTYSFLVTNTGNVELTGITVTETRFTGTNIMPTATCLVTTLAPGASTTCTATYTVTQADVNAGSVTNTATATGTPPVGEAVTTPPANAVVTIPAAPALTVVKSAEPSSVGAAGNTVTYSFAVTNTGNVDLTGVTVAETAFSGTGTPPVISCPSTTLAPGGSQTCTATYTVTQADVNAGSVTNSATATGTPPVGPAVTSPESTAVVMIPAGPALTLVKSVDPTSVSTAGDTVTYTFLVTNTGNVELTGITVTETVFTGRGTAPLLSCLTTTLAPGASTTCTATYSVTQADVNAGSVLNTATATGTPPTGPAVTSPPASAVVTIPAGPALTLLKSVDPTSVSTAGNTVTYSFAVTNTGNVDLTGVTVAESLFSGTGTPPVISCPTTTLAPGASTTCTATYTVTQADVDAGSVTDTATVSGTPPTGPAVTSPESTAVLTIPPGPALTLVKSVEPSSVSIAGNTVSYSFLVTNTGNVDLTAVTATETAFSGTGTPPVISCPPSTLAPGASRTCTATYTVTQADVNAGSVTNSATASGTPPTGPAVTTPESTAVVTIPGGAALTVVKSVDPTSVSSAGNTVTYSFLVTNTGNVDLTGVTVTETAFSGTGTPPVSSCPVTTLAPGASTTCTATYTVTQIDVDAGSVSNTATATGTPPTGPAVTSPPASAVVTIPAGPALTVVKSANPTSVSAAGDTVSYSFLVTNTGNVDLTGVTVTETVFSGTGTPPVISCPPSTLAPGASRTCTATYTVTQADVNAGSVTNSATASGTPPTGPAVTSPESTAVVAIPAGPALTLVKSVDPTSVSSAGGTVTYSFLVTNTGNVELTGVAVTEMAFSGTGTPPVASCPTATLAPGASTTCTATYTVTQADVNAGTVTNTATASGTPPTGPAVTSPPANAAVTIPAAPALTVVKSVDPTSVSAAGDTVTYSFLATNTGNVELTGVVVNETAFSGTGTPPVISCPATTLAPGASTTCTATYTVTQADVNAGSVTNTAAASGTPPSGPAVTSPPANVQVTIPAGPALTVVKSVDPASVGAAGETVTYSFLVTNTGNVDLTGVVVNETAFSGTGTPPVPSCPVTTLAPGASTTCTATYTVTQADLDAGTVSNTATASGTPPTGPAVTSPESSAAVAVAAVSALTLDKTADDPVDANGTNVIDAGDTIAYHFLVTNTGNVTLTHIGVGDEKVGPITCPTTPLPPTQSLTCTVIYTITQADVDAGAVTNTATATATPPPSAPQPNEPTDSTTTSIPAHPRIQLAKSADRTTLIAGETIRYTFTVLNTGNVTLANTRIQEDSFSGTGTLSPLSCNRTVTTTLPPQASMVCVATYLVTQADVDAGTLHNAATAFGTPPTGPDVSSSSELSIPEQIQPAMALHKRATVVDTNHNGVTDAGDQILYSFDVTNTGNVTLTGTTIHDAALAAAGIAISCPAAPLQPGQTTTCQAQAPRIITAANVAAGAVRNTATATATAPRGELVASAPQTLTVTITTPRPPGPLPTTGAPLRDLGMVALLLIGAGGSILSVTRLARRRRR
jgi:uncharacterized repeat protein (TIGR01451 family)